VLNKKGSPEHGHLSIYSNGALAGSFSVKAKESETVKIAIAQDTLLRVQFERTDATKKAEARILMSARGVDSSLDTCMGTKECLAILGSGKGAFALRNSNKLQLRCIEAADPDSVSPMCAPWTECLTEQHQKGNLQSFLRAALGNDDPTAELIANNAHSNDTQHCVHPAIVDAESWECDCYESMMHKCEESDEAFDDCLPRLMCESSHVCESWKHTHCTPSLISSVGTVMVSRSEVGDKAKITDSLDSGLQGKCAEQ